MAGDKEEGPLTARFDLMVFTDELISDLRLLRQGKISVKDASARADLAKQVLRSVRLVVDAQKFIEAQAKPAAAKRITA